VGVDVGIVGVEVVRGNNWWITTVWCLGLAALGYRWSKAVFNRDPK
jgi:ABC-2 type transport system permease protein